MSKRTVDQIDLTADDVDDDPLPPSKVSAFGLGDQVTRWDSDFADAATLRCTKQYLNTVEVPSVDPCDCEARGYEAWKDWVMRGMPRHTLYTMRHGPGRPYASYCCAYCQEHYCEPEYQ